MKYKFDNEEQKNIRERQYAVINRIIILLQSW